MTHHERPNEAEAADEGEVCQHCGAVLDVAQAMQNERSVLRPKTARPMTPAAEPSPPASMRAADDPSVL